MANKKISQLTSATSVEAADLFPIAESAGGSYTTKKCTPANLAEFSLNPIAATQVSGLDKNVYLNNSSWNEASVTVTQNPYLQVRQTDGLLVTGSGIGNAVGGDNMGNCVVTTTLNIQGNPVTGAKDIGFGNVGAGRSYIDSTISYGTDLKVFGWQDLTLSGNRHVNISGQAIDVASTPFSGNVTITGGNLEIDPGNKLIVNEISGKRAGGSDDALLSIEGSSRHVPYAFSPAGSTVNWQDSNIQYAGSTSAGNVDFTNVADGQTLTLYWENTRTDSTNITPNFRSGVAVNAVRWAGEFSNTAPTVAPSKTNVYTFVRINTGIFASAVTGYVY